MALQYIVSKPSVNLVKQRSPVTCWVACAYMLYCWKNGKVTYDQFVMGNLPQGIYGFYLLEEKLLMDNGDMDPDIFNQAFADLDAKWNNLYTIDTPAARQKRLDEFHDYTDDYIAKRLSADIIKVLNETSGVGLPYMYAKEFFTANRNGFKPVGENKTYSAKEWLGIIYHYAPLMVSVRRINPKDGKAFGHFAIVDGFSTISSSIDSTARIHLQDPMNGTLPHQSFVEFSSESQQAIAMVGTLNYIWYSGKSSIANLSVQECVRKLEKDIPNLKG